MGMYSLTDDIELNFNQLNNPDSGAARFSFDLPVLADNRFAVEVITELTLRGGDRRRLQLTSSSNNANIFASNVIVAVILQEDDNNDSTEDPDGSGSSSISNGSSAFSLE